MIKRASTRQRNRRQKSQEQGIEREVDYRHLRNPFPAINLFSEDQIEAMHDTALRTLEELGVKILLKDARELFEKAGAVVDPETEMVKIGRDIIKEALKTAPRSFTIKGGRESTDLLMELGTLAIQTGGGAPHATDIDRGRRPASLADYDELTRITHHFDALHMLNPLVEPQDIPVHLRHYAVTRCQLSLSDKVPFIFSRGQAQVEDCFEMISTFRGLDSDQFDRNPYTYTIINTNSPRQIDVPMARGLIDFARYNQMAVVTPFCLMGAMAPVTVAGALTLSHAEALAAIALNQLTRPGAPVCYGAFASNVDMKSGAPAFGTPEQVKANFGAGQLARKIGLPWRCAAGCAANTNDVQAAQETLMSAWSAIMAGCTILIHGAGWIEGGLTVSYEKLITDMEAMQTFAEIFQPIPADEGAIGFEALKEVQPGGHFFGAAHTMERYKTAFYPPLIADWSNFGTWSENGGLDSNVRANRYWKEVLDEKSGFQPNKNKLEQLDAFIAKRTQEGGAPLED